MKDFDDSTTGASLVQTSPNIRIECGETSAHAGQLMSISKRDGKAYLCGQNSIYKIPAGFLATNFPLVSDCGFVNKEKITLIREGRIRGFANLIPGAVYYPSCTVPGAISSNMGHDENIPVGIAVSQNTLQISICYK